MTSSSRGDRFARLLGALVFLLGIGVICVVLWLGFQMYQDPHLGGQAVSDSKTGPTVADLGIGFAQLLCRIALLFLGSVSGSLIANKGVKLYFSSLPE